MVWLLGVSLVLIFLAVIFFKAELLQQKQYHEINVSFRSEFVSSPAKIFVDKQEVWFGKIEGNPLTSFGGAIEALSVSGEFELELVVAQRKARFLLNISNGSNIEFVVTEHAIEIRQQFESFGYD